MNIAQLKQTVRVENVVGQRIKLRRKGPLFIGYCPFHQDTGRPNLVVFPKTQTWACFACSAQGDVLDFISRVEKVSTKEAKLILESGMETRPAPKVKSKRKVKITNPILRDRAFQALIHQEELSEMHRLALKDRGLTAESIKRNQYRSHNPCLAPGEIRNYYGIPGFYKDNRHWVVVGPPGILIPVRDVDGLIVGCQVRADETDKGKYRWLSSTRRPAGTSSGSPAHVAAGRTQQVWVTEGPLKADVASQCLNTTVIGIAGVATWRNAIPIIKTLNPKEVILAFDRDDNPKARAIVLHIAEEMGDSLRSEGYRVLHASWDGVKGLDDALSEGYDITID